MPHPRSTYVKGTLVITSPQKDHFFNIFYWVPDQDPTWTGNAYVDAATFGTDAGLHISAPLLPCLTMNTYIAGLNVELVKNDIVYDVGSGIGLNGEVNGDELPDQNCVVVQKRTALPGKSGRGRWQVGPVPESLTDENRLTTSGQGFFLPVATAWCTSFNSLGANWTPHLFSKKNNTLTPITVCYPDILIGSIDGRKSKALI